jgi:hypothetical protein
MDEVTIGDFLDFRRSPDGLRVLHGTSDRARRGPLGQGGIGALRIERLLAFETNVKNTTIEEVVLVSEALVKPESELREL